MLPQSIGIVRSDMGARVAVVIDALLVEVRPGRL
jgi:hypothetical protein